MKLKLVFDTNIYLGAVLSADAHLIKFIDKHELYDIYCSIAILDELSDKLLNKFTWDPIDVACYIEAITAKAIMVYPAMKLSGILEDSDDHKILECALEAKADVIITADKGLLKLKDYQDITIAHPSMLKFWFKPDNL